MKSEILKIAGVKSEKEFYKKYPTEAAFKKAHPKAFKGVQTKHAISKAQNYGEMEGPTSSIPGFVEGMGMDSVNGYGVDNLGNVTNGNATTGNSTKKKKDINFKGIGNVANGFFEGMQEIEQEKKEAASKGAFAGASGIVTDAAISNAFVQKPQHQWYNPADPRFVHNTNEQILTQGRGTDVLGQNGSMIGGTPTEVQNTYGIGSNIYKDLQDPDDVKAYQSGGGFGSWFGQANSNFSGSGDTSFMGNIGQGSPFDSFVGNSFGNSGGWKAGSSIGSAFGPIGSFVGGIAGGFLDENPAKIAAAEAKIKFNNDFMSNLNYGNNTHNMFSRNTQNGGYMNPEYNPQVIAKFGELDAQDFADFAHKDQFRAGGHLKEYTAPSERAMETYENGGNITSYALGGKLKSYWGGKVEDESHNPYLPGSGMTAMIKGASHKNGGVGISYSDGKGEYQGYAANGANMGADIEAEDKEPVIEIAENGTKDTKAVVYGNIPTTELMANAFGNESVKRLANKYPGWSMKKIVEERTKDEIKANKNKEKAAKISNDTNANTKWGKLDEATADIIYKSGDDTLKMIADEKTGLADFQDYLQDIKQKLSFVRGKNVSAEAVGRGTIKGKPITIKDVLDGKIDDHDRVTMYAPIENPYAKSGVFLNKAQSGIGWKAALDAEDNYYDDQAPEIIPINPNTNANPNFQPTQLEDVVISGRPMSQQPNITVIDEQAPDIAGSGGSGNDGDITEDQYNDFVKMYQQSQSTKGKKNQSTLDFQRAYHKAFPQEALAAIQKTTRDNGLSNKAKAMGLTVKDILDGKDVARILESNEDQYHGPRTDQYMASVRSHFKKTPPAPDLKLNTLGGTPTTTGTNTTKTPIKVVPYKDNHITDIANILYPFFQTDRIPGIDPRQFTKEHMAIAQNTPYAVQAQKYAPELDPLYRVSYQDIRNASTADFRDALRQGKFDPAVAAGVYGKKAIADQGSYADEFRTNQALEQQIFGGNRAKINQAQAANLQLLADQRDKQLASDAITKQTNLEAVGSIADKSMKYDADVMKYKVQRNLFPQFGYSSSGKIHTQGPWYKPTIPQIYGGESTIEEVPVYGADGKLQYYKMQQKANTTDQPSSSTPPFVPGQGYVSKNGKSIVKNAKNSSVVKAYKNL